VQALTGQKQNETPEAIVEIQTLRLRDLALSDSGFVFDPMTGHSFTVKPSGLRILQWLKEGMTAEEVVWRLADTFELRHSQASSSR
jgi:hypothetical protein